MKGSVKAREEGQLVRLQHDTAKVYTRLIHLFIYFSVNLLQDMEIVISIIIQEKTAAYSIYIYRVSREECARLRENVP